MGGKKSKKKKNEEEEVEAEEDDTVSWNGGAIRTDGGNVFVEQFQYNWSSVPSSCSETVRLAHM